MEPTLLLLSYYGLPCHSLPPAKDPDFLRAEMKQTPQLNAACRLALLREVATRLDAFEARHGHSYAGGEVPRCTQCTAAELKAFARLRQYLSRALPAPEKPTVQPAHAEETALRKATG